MTSSAFLSVSKAAIMGQGELLSADGSMKAVDRLILVLGKLCNAYDALILVLGNYLMPVIYIATQRYEIP